jgi:thiol-disulfide isomerase/thioredoxin
MNLLNQFSYPLIAALVLAVAFVVLYRRTNRTVLIGVELGLLIAFAGGFLALRTGDGDLTSIEAYDTLLINDRPTFIEFFSNFCTGCLVMRPTVDALIADIDDEFNILRVNIHSEAGRALRERLSFSFTPEFVLLNARGVEVWRDHIPPSLDILRQAQ